MHAFHYHRPASLKDALSLGSQKTEGRYLAGGQSLVQAMKLRLSSPTDLIDLNALGDLKTLKAESGSVTIGAMVRHAEVAGSSGVKKTIPALAALAGMIGDRQVRHMGRRITPRLCSAWAPRSPPTSEKSRPTNSSAASTKRRWSRAS